MYDSFAIGYMSEKEIPEPFTSFMIILVNTLLMKLSVLENGSTISRISIKLDLSNSTFPKELFQSPFATSRFSSIIDMKVFNAIIESTNFLSPNQRTQSLLSFQKRNQGDVYCALVLLLPILVIFFF